MLVEAVLRPKQPIAEVALPAATVVVIGVAVGLVRRRTVPADHAIGDGTIRVLAPDELVHGVTIQAPGVGARTRLHVVGYTRGRGIGLLAKGALDGVAAVAAGVKMLPRHGLQS